MCPPPQRSPPFPHTTLFRAPPAAPLSSLTAPRCTPPSTGTSLVPLMVTVISWLAVPSEETAVKLSVSDWPAPSCWIAVCVLSARSEQHTSDVTLLTNLVFLPLLADQNLKVDQPLCTA